MAEWVQSLAELEAELEELLDPDEENRRKFAFIGIPINDLIAETRKRIKWRQHRRSQAKCLHCGPTDIIMLPNSEEFAHPKTGERMVVVGRGFAEANPWQAEFTTEGDLISSSRESDKTRS